MTRALFIATAAFAVLAIVLGTSRSAGHAQSAADLPGSLDVGGVHRTFVAHVPASLPPHPGLILSFHGHYGTGAGQSRLTRLNVPAEAAGDVVVYPDGIDRGWNDGRPETRGADDVAFVKALIVDLERRYAIDPTRIYATGFSNGAILSEYLGCVMADQIAAIAPVSGTLPVDDVASCHPSRRISVLEMAGTADPIIPYGGGKIAYTGIDRGNVLSAAATAAIWAKNAACRAMKTAPINSSAPPDGTSVILTSYQRCASGSPVQLFTIRGGGHAWPGGPQYLPVGIIGPASGQIDASGYIVEFFTAHPLK